MSPALLARSLPYAAGVLVILSALWWLDHRAYQRALSDRDAQDAALLIHLQTELRQSEVRLLGRIDQLAGVYQLQREAIGRVGATFQPIIEKETAHAPHLADPAAGLTDGLLAAINRARATGACTAAATGRIACALPAPPPAGGSDDR
jgi:hypothetical protein